MAYLRQPIISVLGHVDHGKTSLLDCIRNSKIISKEAGGITQHIGATEVPKKNLIKIVEKFITEDKIKIPGLLFIDTPGHKAFTTLRKRGGSICDIGIVIVDIVEGFKPQTIEAVEILRLSKTPFIVVANKVDKIPFSDFKKNKNLVENLEIQKDQAKYKIEEKVYEIVGKLNELDYESDRFDRVDDFTKKIAVVPISVKIELGICELISTIVGLTQKYMEKKLTIENEKSSKGIILEIKDFLGIGKSYDIIIYDGVLRKDDKIFAIGENGIQKSYVKAILKPNSLKEIRDKATKFEKVKEIHAACGVKISVPNFEDVCSGTQIFSTGKSTNDFETKKLEKELLSQKIEIEIESKEYGILVKADTIGSLEALSNILKEHEIPLRVAKIGKIVKMDIIDANCDLKKNPKNALILNFSQKLDNEIKVLAKEYKITILSNDIIYKIVEDAKKWIEEKEKEILKEKLNNLTRPFRIDILEGHIFRKSNPSIVGCEVILGNCFVSKSVMGIEGEKCGNIKSIKENQKYLKELKKGDKGAFAIEGLTIGKIIFENSPLYSFMGEENFKKLKENKELLNSDEKICLKEIADIMRKKNQFWGF